MPVKSSTSSVLRWPDAARVRGAAQRWADRLARERPEVVAVGYFGSYARGDWGPGSDLDVVVLCTACAEPFGLRGARYDATELPVPADVLVYTLEEWRRLEGSRFRATLEREAAWLVQRSETR